MTRLPTLALCLLAAQPALATERASIACTFDSVCHDLQSCEDVAMPVVLMREDAGMRLVSPSDPEGQRFVQVGPDDPDGPALMFLGYAVDDHGSSTTILSLHANGRVAMTVHSAGQILVFETFSGRCETED